MTRYSTSELFFNTLLGMTQAEVADQLGVAANAVTQYEKGQRELGATDMSRLAEILKVPVAYFYGDDEIEGPLINTYYEGLSPARRSTADEVIRALWLEEQRAETTHGKKAE